MGLFLSLSGIIGKSATDVEKSLENYLKTIQGGIEKANIDSDDNNFCAIGETEGNTTVMYPPHFLEWDECSKFLSKDMNTPVFSCHIHDGDFWMYILFSNGEIKDQFMPIPDYFDDVSTEEIDSWKGDAVTLTLYVPNLKPESIEKYLIRWDLDEEGKKAYEEDKSTNCDWQLVDFMDKLGLPYLIDDKGNVSGTTYKLWTKQLPIKSQTAPSVASGQKLNVKAEKPWWKFW
jgi:hypothetical protein